MCGIVGVVAFDGTPIERELIESMNALVVHRGPDEDGFYFDKGVGMAMRRLSVIDVEGGTQPFCNETGDVVTVYNGEIYNYQELRHTLRQTGHVVSSSCDTAVIPHLYEDYGADFVQLLTGMFAVAVWDRHSSSLFLARDRLGIKPLHYALSHGRLYFASEIKSLKPCGILNELEPTAIYHYLTYGYIPAPLTIYQNVFKLPPANCLELRNGEIRVSRYWDIPDGEVTGRSEAELIDELHERLLEAVKIRLVSDVPLGAFLSGGVDSSLVVALMCEAGHSRTKTFSIGFDESSHDESAYARAVAAQFGTDHTELTVRSDVWRHIERIVLQFDEPFADSSAIPTYFLSALTREHVTVALSGDGGDELFAGYDRYHDYSRKRPLYRIPRWIRGMTCGLLADALPTGTRGKRFLRTLRLEPFDDYVYGSSELKHSELLTEEFLDTLKGIDPLQPARASLGRDLRCELDMLCRYDMSLYLPDDILTKVDRTSMAVSLEVRVPLLDHHVVEFATALPANLRLRGGVGKYILKRLLERYMPREHVYRKKKGFGVPLGEWFRNELHDELMAVLSPSRIRETGVFCPEAVGMLMKQHMLRQRDHKPLLWRLFVFHLWDWSRR